MLISPLVTSSLLCHNDKYIKYLHTSYIPSIAHSIKFYYNAYCYKTIPHSKINLSYIITLVT